MGNKTHPYGIRLGITTLWKATWYAKPREYAELFHQDCQARKYIEEKLGRLNISSVQIERLLKEVKISAYLARASFVFAKNEKLLHELIHHLKEIMHLNVKLHVYEVKMQELDAKLVSANIAHQLESRAPFRRVTQRAITLALKSGALGIRIIVSGRLGGAEIARREVAKKNNMPLHTLSAPIQYGFSEAMTLYGIIGVKVYIYV